MLEHIDLFVEGAPEGRTQPVEVEECREGIYRVLYSPGFVEGLAAEDLICLTDPELGKFEIVERGPNIAFKWAAGRELGSALREADRILSELGARWDGAIRTAAVWTVPVTCGLAALERAIEQVTALIPGSECWHGHAHDENGDPLDRW